MRRPLVRLPTCRLHSSFRYLLLLSPLPSHPSHRPRSQPTLVRRMHVRPSFSAAFCYKFVDSNLYPKSPNLTGRTELGAQARSCGSPPKTPTSLAQVYGTVVVPPRMASPQRIRLKRGEDWNKSPTCGIADN
ncbi:hypothetical protein AXF42_Ash013108 [Apostasia shenzhenica]|uniref:Uncharacterized protein n=1 Tax=Apostasia shenzhenica TaxID=1088818 RepID=A0A2I0BD24_9ASPA|nr:hypothetical protein AXF42_Ash013108 [Apostasia shenzhenica]